MMMTKAALISEDAETSTLENSQETILNPKFCCGFPLDKKITEIVSIYTCKKCNKGIVIPK